MFSLQSVLCTTEFSQKTPLFKRCFQFRILAIPKMTLDSTSRLFQRKTTTTTGTRNNLSAGSQSHLYSVGA
jgi:hypothetical protein